MDPQVSFIVNVGGAAAVEAAGAAEARPVPQSVGTLGSGAAASAQAGLPVPEPVAAVGAAGGALPLPWEGPVSGQLAKPHATGSAASEPGEQEPPVPEPVESLEEGD